MACFLLHFRAGRRAICLCWKSIRRKGKRMTEEGTLGIVMLENAYKVRYASNNPRSMDRQHYQCTDEAELGAFLQQLEIDSCISNRCLQSFGKDGLLPFPSSYLLSRFRSTLHHNRTSLTTEDRQVWRISLDSALQTWGALLVLASVPANCLDLSVQTLVCVAYSSYVHINPDRYTQTFPRLLHA
jgi:hypothetical protein